MTYKMKKSWKDMKKLKKMNNEEIIIDLTEIEKKYKDKCSLIKAGKCKNVNIFLEQSRKLKAKEQECEELKEQLTILDDEDVVVEITVKQFEKYKKHKQILAEIKEIAEANKNYKFKIPEISCAGDTLELKFDVLEEILQKINEVNDV